MSKNAIVKAVIYPAVGIARVGNAPVTNDTDYFLGPEVTGQVPDPPGGFKDKKGRVKKQGARFRVYGLGADGKVIKEITSDDAAIEWRVHLCNSKAGWYQFNNALDLLGMAIPSAFRNGTVADRSALIIDGGQISITGNNTNGEKYYFNNGEFMGTKVPLGQLRTDEKGRLIVLGGDGHSASYTNAQAITFANNDTWHDDVGDGPVRATIKLADGTVLEAEPSMVAVTPPNFGQGLYAVVSMYDVVYNLHAEQGWIKKPSMPDFWENIFPILKRMVQTQWVNQGFYMLFGKNSPSDFTQPELLKQLSSRDTADEPLRRRIYEWFRDPLSEEYRPAAVPPFYGDAFGDYENIANVDLPVTAIQYEWLRQWAEGSFTTNTPPVYNSLEEVPLQEQPQMLTKTNLDDCLGGPFHPGIELTWPLRVPLTWSSPFRMSIMPENEMPVNDWGTLLNTKIVLSPTGPLAANGPGSLTRWMGVPWQTDEASCLSGYDVSTYLPLPSFWAARVPNQVLSKDSFKRISDERLNTAQRLKHLDYRQDWLRDFGTVYQKKINAMINKWHYLGIIVQQRAVPGKAGDLLPIDYWVETGRRDFDTPDPSFEQVLYAENAETITPMPKAAGLGLLEAKEPVAAPKRERTVMRRDEV